MSAPRASLIYSRPRCAAAPQEAKAKASSSGGERPRDKLKREAMERAAKFDADRGRGGEKEKKKGWFG